MPYVPRPTTHQPCAHCGQTFESRNLRRKYCSNSCNVLASYDRTGRRGEPRPTKADLESVVKKIMELTTAKAKPSLAEAKLRSQELAKQIGDDLAAAKAERLAEAKIKMKELGKKMKEDDLAAAKGEHLVKAAKRPQKP